MLYILYLCLLVKQSTGETMEHLVNPRTIMTMEYNIVNFDDSYIEKVVQMWRPSKKIATDKEDIHSIEDYKAFLKNVLAKQTTIQLAVDLKNE